MVENTVIKIKYFLNKVELGEEEETKPLKERYEYMKKIFSQISTLVNKRNIPVVVIYLTHKKVDLSRLKMVKDAVTRNNFYFLDVSHRFETDGKKYWIYLTDSHPNDKAHNLFADEIYQFLKSHSLIR